MRASAYLRSKFAPAAGGMPRSARMHGQSGLNPMFPRPPMLDGAGNGTSAYLLRKSAPASAACRRPRPLATNAPRLFNARALHRVRFSAVRTRKKIAGRYGYLPACYLWWRRGESNSGPRKPPDWHLQAQSLVLSRTLCAQRHARGVLTGSVLACAIPITCAGAFP